MSARGFLNDRLKEVDQYLRFLSLIDKPSSALVTTLGRHAPPVGIEPDMRRILKANFFVIYYNTVEAAISEGMNYIFNDIERRNTEYVSSNHKIRRLFVKDTLRRNLGDSIDRGRIYDESKNCLDYVTLGHPLSFNRDDKRAPGNLDADKIRMICDIFGVSKSTPQRSMGGVDLGLVVSKRNILAHGDATFTEVGRDYSVGDLRGIRRRSASFLRAIVRNMEAYADNQRYLVN